MISSRNQGSNALVKQANGSKVIGHFNLDFVGHLETRKSTMDYVFLIIVGAVSWLVPN